MNTAIDKLITEYSRDLTRLCMSLCSNEADAEDLFQDTWFKVMKNFNKYNSERPFDKWLFSICVNTYKNSLRLGFNRYRCHFSSEEEQTRFINSIPDPDTDRKEDYTVLHSAISKLPKKQRMVIVLYYFKDYSIKEISEIINIPEGTVKSRLSVAKRTLKRRLTDEET